MSDLVNVPRILLCTLLLSLMSYKTLRLILFVFYFIVFCYVMVMSMTCLGSLGIQFIMSHLGCTVGRDRKLDIEIDFQDFVSLFYL